MVQIFAEEDLVKHIESGQKHYSHLISIGNPRRFFGGANPGQTMPLLFRRSFKEILRLEFFDVEIREHLGPMRPKRVAMLKDVRRAIHFYRRTRNHASGFTFHCWSGISRSPALALGYLYLISGSESEAGKLLRELRPQAMPLRILVRYFDEILGCNLSIVNDEIRTERIAEMKRELMADVVELIEELPLAEE